MQEQTRIDTGNCQFAWRTYGLCGAFISKRTGLSEDMVAEAPCHYWQLDGRAIGKAYLPNPSRSHPAMWQIGKQQKSFTNLIHGKEAGVEISLLTATREY